MEEKDSKEISKKKISEKPKLHPTTPESTKTSALKGVSSRKRHIAKKRVTKSKYVGVSWCSERGRWHATLSVGRKYIDLGRHMTEEGAALAYDEYCRKLIKRFTRNLNFPDESDGSAVAQSDQVLADAEIVVQSDGESEGGEDVDFFGPTTVSDYVDAQNSVNVDDVDGEESS